MLRPQQQAHNVGHHQTHKTDQSANGDSGGGHERCQHDKEELVPLDTQSQVRRTLLTQRKCIEDARETHGADDAKDDNDSHDQHRLPACDCNAAGEPVEERLDAKTRVGAERQNKRLERDQYSVDDDTRQQQRDDGRVPIRAREKIDEHHCDQRPNERQ